MYSSSDFGKLWFLYVNQLVLTWSSIKNRIKQRYLKSTPKDTIAKPLCKRISRGFGLESGYIKLDTLIRYMKVVLLAGGFGSRISEESQFKPKPMIEIGGMPILWHIMEEYAYYGHTEFIICAGYKQEYIKEWFANYFLHNSDVTFDYRNGKNEMTVHQTNMEPWKVTVVDTGYNTMTGGRIKRIQKYVGNEPFLMTYGDGVCDVEIDKLVEFHKSHGKLATLTAVKMVQDKGVLDITKDQAVRAFREKNASDGAPINAGYMVLQPEVFDLLDGDSCVFEKTALVELANLGQLMSYVHTGFWQCMDNIREKSMLEKLLAENKAPWKKWERTIPEIPDYAK